MQHAHSHHTRVSKQPLHGSVMKDQHEAPHLARPVHPSLSTFARCAHTCGQRSMFITARTPPGYLFHDSAASQAIPIPQHTAAANPCAFRSHRRGAISTKAPNAAVQHLMSPLQKRSADSTNQKVIHCEHALTQTSPSQPLLLHAMRGKACVSLQHPLLGRQKAQRWLQSIFKHEVYVAQPVVHHSPQYRAYLASMVALPAQRKRTVQQKTKNNPLQTHKRKLAVAPRLCITKVCSHQTGRCTPGNAAATLPASSQHPLSKPLPFTTPGIGAAL